METVNTTRRGFFGHAAGAYALVAGTTMSSVVITDPMLSLIDRIRAAQNYRDTNFDGKAADEYTRHAIAPLEADLFQRTPQVTSLKGGAEAIRQVLFYEEVNEEDANVLRSVADFLDRKAA